MTKTPQQIRNEVEKEKKCKHNFKVLREHKVANILGDGEVNTILQCIKCLRVYEIEDNNTIKEVYVKENLYK